MKEVKCFIGLNIISIFVHVSAADYRLRNKTKYKHDTDLLKNS